MKITQTDVATLSDTDIQRLAVIADGASTAGGPFAPFWRAFSSAAVMAMRERRRILALLEQDVLDAEDGHVVGRIVTDDSDLVGDAATQLRRAARHAATPSDTNTP